MVKLIEVVEVVVIGSVVVLCGFKDIVVLFFLLLFIVEVEVLVFVCDVFNVCVVVFVVFLEKFEFVKCEKLLLYIRNKEKK